MTNNKIIQDLLYFKAVKVGNMFNMNIKLTTTDKIDKNNDYTVILSILN